MALSEPLITWEEIDAASRAGEGPKLMNWCRVLERLRLAEGLERLAVPEDAIYRPMGLEEATEKSR